VHAQHPGGDRPAPTDDGPRRTTTVVIPVRALEGAKSRLGLVLDAEERRELVERLLRRTVAAALGTPGVARVVVVSPDPDVLAIGDGEGADGVRQRSAGLNPGIVEAREARDDDRILVLPGDLPTITPADVAAILAAADAAAAGGRPVVVLAPDRHGRGTNALLLDPPGVIEPAFGRDSRDAHARLAAAAGAVFVELAGVLGLDVDTPDDLLLAEALHPDAVRVR
jgi:2-phospho-L-lactate/phosphoenolpyruvate guanylyltransferase